MSDAAAAVAEAKASDVESDPDISISEDEEDEEEEEEGSEYSDPRMARAMSDTYAPPMHLNALWLLEGTLCTRLHIYTCDVIIHTQGINLTSIVI